MSQTKTWQATAGTCVSTPHGGGTVRGAGDIKRLYAGFYGNTDYDSFLKFDNDWDDVGRIVSATLTIFSDDGLGILGDTLTSSEFPGVILKMLKSAFSEHTGSEIFVTADATAPSSTTSQQKSVYTSSAPLFVNNIDITGIAEQWAPSNVQRRNGKAGGKATNHGIGIYGWAKRANNAAFVSEDAEIGLDAYKPYITLVYEYGATVPGLPTVLAPEGDVAGFEFFEGDFNDVRPTDTLRYSEVEVYTETAINTGQVVTGGTRIYGPTRQQESDAAILAGRFSHSAPNLRLSRNTDYRWRARVTDNEGQVSLWTDLVTFGVTNTEPDAPTLLPASGSIFANLSGMLFRGAYSDPEDDPLHAYQVQLSAYPEGVEWDTISNIRWDSGKRLLPSDATDSWETGYGGPGLEADTYYWRARHWDSHNGVSEWAYSDFDLTVDFDIQPGSQSVVQVRPRVPHRILIKDIAEQEDPDIELIQSASFGAPTDPIVQSKWGTAVGGGNSVTTTFDTPVDPGSTLVAFLFTGNSSAGNTIDTAGWTKRDEALSVGTWNDAISVWTAAGTAGDSVNVPTNGVGGSTRALVLYEVDGTYDVSDAVTDTSPATTTGPVLTAGGDGVLIAALIGSNQVYNGVAVITPVAPLTEDHAVAKDVSGRAHRWVGHHNVLDGVSYTPSVTVGSPVFVTTDAMAAIILTAASSATSLALVDPPTEGNTLVICLSGRSTLPPLPSGFTNVSSFSTSATTQRWGRLAYRLVEEGDTGDVSTTAKEGVLMEWSGVYDHKFIASGKHASTTAFRGGAAGVAPTAGVDSVIVGMGVIGTADSPSLTVDTTPTASVTVFDTFSTAPLLWVGYRHIAAPTGIKYTTGGTLNSASVYGGATMVLVKRHVSRGPNNVIAIIEDAKGVGASKMYNSPGELHFTIPADHPQISVIEPKQTHYSVEFRQGDGWREVFAGVIWDFDATHEEVIFYGIDYLALFDYVLDERWDPSMIDRPPPLGSKYVEETIRDVIHDSLLYAIRKANSPVNFIGLSVIEAMDEIVTIYSTMQPTLQFVTGLIDSHRQGTGKRTRIKVVKTTSGGYNVTVEEDPGVTKENLRLSYGELVQGYRVVPFGTAWASRVHGIARSRTGVRTWYQSESAPGIDPTVWGSIATAQVFDGVTDQNDFIRRLKQAALTAGKLGKSVALGLRNGILRPFDGYDLTDAIPIDIVDGPVDTGAFGSGLWDVMGVTWQVGPQSEENLTLTLFPHEDQTEPSEDLVGNSNASPQAEWQLGYEAPDPDEVGAQYYMDIATGIIYRRDESGSQDDDVTAADGVINEDEV